MDVDLGHVGKDVFAWSHFQVKKDRLAGVLGESKRKQEGNKGQGSDRTPVSTGRCGTLAGPKGSAWGTPTSHAEQPLCSLKN